MTDPILTCEAFDELLPEYLEGTLDAAARVRAEAHLGSCVRCTGLVRDLAAIEQDAGALPELSPRRDLWEGIAARIEAPVIAIAAPAAEPRRRWPATWLAAAAAGLVLATALTTYQVTVRAIRDADGLAGTAPAIAPGAGETNAAESSRVLAGLPSVVTPAGLAGVTAGDDESAGRSPVTRRGAAAAPAAGVPSVLASAVSGAAPGGVRSAADTYDAEIAQLRVIVAQRETGLDSATVAVLSRNLQIIDSAIAQSRAALARDPGSAFLNEQLTHVLDKKLQLLRRAARLPSST